jgi:hypothetical protein
LQVTGRTSSFYFKGEHSDLATIARKLNVAALLEGSVRRSANTVRITTQLINASTGFHLWTQTYDRDLGDVLKPQSEIADAVARALKVTLLGDIATKIELGGRRNPAAFDAYLRGAKALNNSVPNFKLVQTALASFTEAIGLDANYALAFAGRSLALIDYSAYFVTGAAIREGFDKALADARHALALAPGLPEGQMAMARIFAWGSLDFTQASEAGSARCRSHRVMHGYCESTAYLPWGWADRTWDWRPPAARSCWTRLGPAATLRSAKRYFLPIITRSR